VWALRSRFLKNGVDKVYPARGGSFMHQAKSKPFEDGASLDLYGWLETAYCDSCL
jgi:hypothetical protein